jgi:membrane protein implicated in regulation of membrane protease activity
MSEEPVRKWVQALAYLLALLPGVIWFFFSPYAGLSIPQIPDWLTALAVSTVSILVAGVLVSLWNLFRGKEQERVLFQKLDRIADAMERLADQIAKDREERERNT